MGEYTQATEVSAPADTLFDYLADVANLPKYFSAMTSAECVGHEEVHTIAEVHGTRREGDAWFRVDTDRRELQWGSEGQSDYEGHLQVSGNGAASTVTVSLHTERTETSEIDDALRRTLENIKTQVEGSYVSPS